jgi:hypothetical protein
MKEILARNRMRQLRKVCVRLRESNLKELKSEKERKRNIYRESKR